MGWWNAAPNGDSLCEEPTGLVWGDEPADALSIVFNPGGGGALEKRLKIALRTIQVQFESAFNRLPTQEEIVAGILFSLGEVREFIDTLPEGPAPFPGWTLPGMLNVGPVCDAEMEGLRRIMAKRP